MWACHEASFARAHCRLDVHIESFPDGRKYVVRPYVVDPCGIVRPVVHADGGRAQLYGRSELSAVSTAVTYLEGFFGAFCEITYHCDQFVEEAPLGPPYVIRPEAPADLG